MDISVIVNLLAIPGAKYANVKVDGKEQPTIIIPADAELLSIRKRENGKIQASLPIYVKQLSAERSARLKSNPTHSVTLNPNEEYRAAMIEKIRLYLVTKSPEKYAAFINENFQNASGNAKLPANAEEAAKWYVNRILEAGLGWQQKQQAPKAEESVEIVSASIETPNVEPGDDLPF